MSEPPFEMRIDPAKVRAHQARTTLWMAGCCVLSGVVFLMNKTIPTQGKLNVKL
jgi:hypothetical protein